MGKKIRASKRASEEPRSGSPQRVDGERRGMGLDEAANELVQMAHEERDPFMRKLLLATAAGALAESAFRENGAGGALPID